MLSTYIKVERKFVNKHGISIECPIAIKMDYNYKVN